jgi:hypothetical protein
MTIRDTIAATLSPSMDGEARRYRYLHNQIKTEIWWLAEFPDVRDTLQRLLDTDRNYWRGAEEPYYGDLPYSIVDFREMLRGRNASQEMAQLKSDLARALDANGRQASCLHQCAAAIGPDTSWTVDGLPRAVKHLVEQLRQTQSGIDAATAFASAAHGMPPFVMINGELQVNPSYLTSLTDEDKVKAIIDAVEDIIADADVSFPAGREAGASITYDTEELRQKLVAILATTWLPVRMSYGEKIKGIREEPSNSEELSDG